MAYGLKACSCHPLSKSIFKESGDALCTDESHELQQLRNEIKESLAVEPTCIDRIE